MAGDGSSPEAAGRRLLRIAFGIIWIFDGLLQAQASMPLGMTTHVIEPTAASSPAWVQHLVNAGATIWSNHPTAVPASAVWIQIGLGIWLIVAPRGRWSQLAGLATAVLGNRRVDLRRKLRWHLRPGPQWAFGAPGAVVFYILAGLLVALPERAWTSPRLGRGILFVMGLFFTGHGGTAGMAGAGLLARPTGSQRPGNSRRHGAADVRDSAAGVHLIVADRLCRF